ncbi:MAG: efflux RND transporter periplasmic adaptor subunit [Lacipirellulaceae bacterium]
MLEKLLAAGRYGFLVLMTIASAAVMWWISLPSDPTARLLSEAAMAPVPESALPKVPVRVEPVAATRCDVTQRYSGKVQAWETFTLGFEIAGRVSELGKNSDAQPLDDGDRVEAGQVLATLDDRILRARKAEAVAQYELAASDLERSRRVREQSPDALAEADFQTDVTQHALRQAAQEMALKNLEDATLTSPIGGSIVRRMAEVGESVGANATVFEVVENDRLRLVLNVPEARVRELEVRRRFVEGVKRGERSSNDAEDAVFRAHVKLEGADVYGRPWPPIDAEVYRIAQTADTITGLFEVEVLIPNADGLLRPGMVATADVVTDRIEAYAVPETSVVFRSTGAYLFTVDEVAAPAQVLFWNVGHTDALRARKINLTNWIDQGDTVLAPSNGLSLGSVVTRGQQRLRDGQLVRVADAPPAGDRTTVAARPAG